MQNVRTLRCNKSFLWKRLKASWNIRTPDPVESFCINTCVLGVSLSHFSPSHGPLRFVIGHSLVTRVSRAEGGGWNGVLCPWVWIKPEIGDISGWHHLFPPQNGAWETSAEIPYSGPVQVMENLESSKI